MKGAMSVDLQKENNTDHLHHEDPLQNSHQELRLQEMQIVSRTGC